MSSKSQEQQDLKTKIGRHLVLTMLLQTAMNERRFLRVKRRFDNSSASGYVTAVGPNFFIFCLVDDRIRFNGFECFRITDLKDVKKDPYADFALNALKKRGQRRPRKPAIDVESIGSILLTANKAFPLVTIHMEKDDPDVCNIGKVISITNKRVCLLGIDPHAKWDEEPEEFPLKKITRICFGGDYEDALYLVGGDPKFMISNQASPKKQYLNSHRTPA